MLLAYLKRSCKHFDLILLITSLDKAECNCFSFNCSKISYQLNEDNILAYNEVVNGLNKETKNILFSQVVPSFNDNSKYIILEYKRLMRKYSKDEPLGFISLESFLAAKMVVNAIKKVEGSLTREKFLRQIRKISKKAKEDKVPDSKEYLNRVHLFKYENKKFVEINNEN